MIWNAIYLTVVLWCFVGGVGVWRWRYPSRPVAAVELAAPTVRWFRDLIESPTEGSTSAPPESAPTIIKILVSYNSLTGGQSKFSQDGEFYLQGINEYRIYRCAVAKEFYDAAHENEHYLIPAASCVEIKP